MYVPVNHSPDSIRNEDLHLPGRHAFDMLLLRQRVFDFRLATFTVFPVGGEENANLTNAHAAPKLANASRSFEEILGSLFILDAEHESGIRCTGNIISKAAANL